MIDIEFYDTEEGSCPVQEYLDTLEPKLLAKTLRTIDLLETNGTKLRMPFSEHIKDGIFELRAKVGSDISRVFVLFHSRPTGDPYQRIYQENTEDTAC